MHSKHWYAWYVVAAMSYVIFAEAAWLMLIILCELIGASLNEPQGVMISTALACVPACVRMCQRGLPGND